MEEEFEENRNRSPEADLREELIYFYFYKRDELLDIGRSYQEECEPPLLMDGDARGNRAGQRVQKHPMAGWHGVDVPGRTNQFSLA